MRASSSMGRSRFPLPPRNAVRNDYPFWPFRFWDRGRWIPVHLHALISKCWGSSSDRWGHWWKIPLCFGLPKQNPPSNVTSNNIGQEMLSRAKWSKADCGRMILDRQLVDGRSKSKKTGKQILRPGSLFPFSSSSLPIKLTGKTWYWWSKRPQSFPRLNGLATSWWPSSFSPAWHTASEEAAGSAIAPEEAPAEHGGSQVSMSVFRCWPNATSNKQKQHKGTARDSNSAEKIQKTSLDIRAWPGRNALVSRRILTVQKTRSCRAESCRGKFAFRWPQSVCQGFSLRNSQVFCFKSPIPNLGSLRDWILQHKVHIQREEKSKECTCRKPNPVDSLFQVLVKDPCLALALALGTTTKHGETTKPEQNMAVFGVFSSHATVV